MFHCHFVFTQNDDLSRIEFAETLLSKSALVEVEFQQLDSVLFLINYYQSKAPIALYQRAIIKANQSEKFEKYGGIFEMRLSDIYWEYENLDSSRHYINRAAERFNLLNEEIAYARTANIRRLIYSSESDFLSAYNVSFEALDIFEKNKDLVGIGICSRDICSIMIHEEKYDDAITYCTRSIEVLESIDFWYELNFSYQRMGIIHRNLGDFENAHLYIQKAIDACRKLYGFREKQGVSKLLVTRGYVYEEEGKYELAIAALDSASRLSKEVNAILDRWILDAKGRIYLKQEKYKEALAVFLEELDFMNRSDLKSKSYDYYNPLIKNLSEAYAGLGQYEKAYAFTKKMAAAKDSIFKIESEEKISEMKTKYETVQKEAKIQSLESEKDAQRQFLIFVTCLLTAISAVVILLYRNNKYRSSVNRELKIQKKEIEQKNEQNELLLKEIHHRVKNNLQTISSLLSLQSESIGDKNAFDAVQESKNRVASMAQLHQKLYQGENLAAVEMRDYFETIGKSIIDSFGEKADNISLNVEMQEVELDVDTAVPVGLIANELVTNSIKHAFPNGKKGEISIALTHEGNRQLKLNISDNGQYKSNESSTKKENGFGTLLIQLLTTQLGGKLEKTTKVGTSTVIEFTMKE